jgi:hypothetical protein
MPSLNFRAVAVALWLATLLASLADARFGETGLMAAGGSVAVLVLVLFVCAAVRRLKNHWGDWRAGAATRRATMGPPSGGGEVTFLISVFLLIFVLLAFSEEFTSGICAAEHRGAKCAAHYYWMDAAIFVVVSFWALLRYRRRTWHIAWLPYVVGWMSMFALDAVENGRSEDRRWFDDVLLSVAFMISITAIVAGIVGAGSRHVRQQSETGSRCRVRIWRMAKAPFTDLSPLIPFWHTRQPPVEARVEQGFAWRRFSTVTPLFAGTFSAYLAGVAWDRNTEVNQEFFAQVSQIIVLLIVAVGLESRLHGNWRSRHPVEKATSIVAMIMLLVGEGLTLGALVKENLKGWASYIAFIVTAEAVSIAFAYLVWTLAVNIGKDSEGDASTD